LPIHYWNTGPHLSIKRLVSVSQATFNHKVSSHHCDPWCGRKCCCKCWQWRVVTQTQLRGSRVDCQRAPGNHVAPSSDKQWPIKLTRQTTVQHDTLHYGTHYTASSYHVTYDNITVII